MPRLMTLICTPLTGIPPSPVTTPVIVPTVPWALSDDAKLQSAATVTLTSVSRRMTLRSARLEFLFKTTSMERDAVSGYRVSGIGYQVRATGNGKRLAVSGYGRLAGERFAA